MHDIFRDTPIFQEILREGIGQGREEGREEGIEQGRLEFARHILLTFTERRFPDLAPLAQEQGAKIQDVAVIEKLITAITSVQNELEAYYALRGRDIKTQS
jgi:predicted transposase YdaD